METTNSILIIVIGLVILGSVALWLGRKIKINKGDNGFSLETDAKEVPKKNDITVADELEVSNGAKVGDIAGYKGASTSLKDATEQDINVMNKGKIGSEATVGDIIGIKTTGQTPEKK